MTRILLFSIVIIVGNLVYAQESFEDLLTAVQVNDSATAAKLLARGMNVETADRNGNTLLIIASTEGHFGLAKRLLDLNANPLKRNGFGESPLMMAALKDHLEIVKLLHAYGSQINHSGWTALHYCAWGGNTTVCSYLIENGAQVNALSANGTTPLMMAARQGHLEAVKFLLSSSADASPRNQSGESALSWATRAGNTKIAELLEAGGSADRKIK